MIRGGESLMALKGAFFSMASVRLKLSSRTKCPASFTGILVQFGITFARRMASSLVYSKDRPVIHSKCKNMWNGWKCNQSYSKSITQRY